MNKWEEYFLYGGEMPAITLIGTEENIENGED